MIAKPAYLAASIRHAKPNPGTVTVVTLYHDDDCPKLRGGECRCNPDLELLKRADKCPQKRKERR